MYVTASNVTSDDFDTTLIVCLLRNMTPREIAPVKGWDLLPDPADISKSADLARIKWYRNKLAHDGDGKLSPTDFRLYWRDLECAIGRLAGPSMLNEAQSAQHIVLDRSLRDILNSLRNCEKEVDNFQMLQEEHTSMINNLQSVIDNQSIITEEQEKKIQRLNYSLQKVETDSKKLYIKLSDCKRIIKKSSEEVEVFKKEIEKTELIYKGIQEKVIHEKKRVDDLIRELVLENDIKFKEIDEQLIKHDEALTKHDERLTKHDERLTKHDERLTKNDEQFTTFDEGLTTHDEQIATCMKEIGDIKKNQYDTHDSQGETSSTNQLYDTKVLIEEDIREDTFVTTEAVTESLSLLRMNGVLLITGCAGTGKSRIGRHVLRMYCTSDTSYTCIKLNTLDEWEDMVSKQDNVVVLLDDIFGETNCIYNREKDTQILDKIHAYICKGNIKVIITIRDTVKRQCREVFDKHRLFKFDFIDLSSDRYGLNREEKRNILKKYMKTVRQLDYTDDGEFVDCNGVTILNTIDVWKITEENPVKGFPLAIYQFVHNVKYFHLGSQFFDRPTESMLEEFNEIRRKGRDHRKFMMHYAVMVYTAINGNCINLQDRSIVTGVTKITDAIYGETIRLNKCHISDTVHELIGSYLITIPNQRSYRFHHPTLQESVILSFAQIDEENIKNIIPLLSWSFIEKMVKPETYIEKEGEVVLGIPTTSYKLLTERLVEIYMAELRKDIQNAYVFVSNISYTDLFKQDTFLLLTYLLEVLENEDKKDKNMEYINNEFDSFDVSIKCGNFFLANLLMSVAKTERQLEMYNIILQNVKDIIKTNNDYVTMDYFKAALMSSVYEICSTKDVRCVKATLNLVKEIKMPILLDQSIDLIKIGLTPDILEKIGYSFMGTNCIFLVFCIWKAYEAYNVSVLEYLLSLYNGTSFHLKLFLKLVYSENWIKGSPSLSYRPLKWIIERFKDRKLVDTDFIFRTASRYQLFDTVEYLVSRGITFNAISCLQICLNESDKVVHQDFYKLLFSKIDITSPEMKSVIISILQKPCVPDYMCDTLLPVCIDNGELLDAACKEGHFYLSKLIMEKSHNVSIQSALISACRGKRKIYRDRFELYHKDEKLEIVKYIVKNYEYTQFNLKPVCQQAYRSRNFKIIEWFVHNIDITLLDSFYILNSALVDEKSKILEYITNKTELAILDNNRVLKSLTKHYHVGCSDKILQLVSIIWDRTKDKETIKIQEIVDMAYDNNCIELLMWIYENCYSYISIDANKFVMLACKKGRIDEAKWVLQNFGKKSLDIDEGELFLLTCDGMSDFIYQTETISMINWVLNNFQIKPDYLKAEVFKLLSGEMDIYPFEKYEDFFYLIVSLLKGCFNSLESEDMEEIMNKSLEGGFYDLVIWNLENMSSYSFNEQKILNTVCKNADIETIMVLNKSSSSLDMNQAMIRLMIHAKTGIEDYHRVEYLDQLWTKIDHQSLDMRKIVSTVCSKGPIANILKWILLNLPYDQKSINTILISCTQKRNLSLVKYICSAVDNEHLDILAAFRKACLRPRGSCKLYHPDLWIGGFQKTLGVVDFLFKKVQCILSDLSLVLEELLEKIKSYDVILYFLVKGYCRNIDMKNLMNEACRHGHVKLVQWILENVEHKELNIESACLEASKCSNNELRYQCVAFLGHYLQDKNNFDMDNVLKSITDTSPEWTDNFYDMYGVSLNTTDFSSDMPDMSDDSDITDISDDLDNLLRFLASNSQGH
ncbi:unnamed protein product [Mytilus coruscus]|uniref:Uncharacterized protein n=1 Tax=Mytilus coruscus TaxID=42192 RepID=A0A6J8BXR0_MYTCO|nr:unnamed protein product [Mytilus coruscus]